MIKNISVIGAGTMGLGIANVFAVFGYNVSLYEPFEAVRVSAKDNIERDLKLMASEDYIDPSLIQDSLDRITVFSELADAASQADYVIEAIPEQMELKQDLFLKLDAICPEHTILASNTSSLTLSEMISVLPDSRKARTMICHWYNPGHLIPIAELSFFGNMDESVFDEVYALYVKCEKQPITVLKDIPGLVANRILHSQAREIFNLIDIGAATPEDIDKALKFGPGFRSATTGILEVADMGGLDIWCAAQDNLFKTLDNSERANNSLRRKVETGKLGIKTGEGYFQYPDDMKESVKTAFYRRLIVQLKASKQYI